MLINLWINKEVIHKN